MICTKCGAQLSAGALFCTKCGTQFPKSDVQDVKAKQQMTVSLDVDSGLKRRKTPKKKVLVIGLVMAVVILLLAAVGGYLSWYFSPEQRVIRALDAGDYDEAEAAFKDDISLRSNFDVGELLSERILTIRNEYLEGKMEYSAVLSELASIEELKVKVVLDEVADLRMFSERIDTSRKHFSAAEEFYSSGETLKAIDEYKQVIEDDPNYPRAQEMIASINDERLKKVFDNAAEYADKGEYDFAILLLENSLSVFEYDSRILQMIALYEEMQIEQQKTNALEEAQQYADVGDYDKALLVLNQYLDSFPDDEEVAQKAKEYSEAKYVHEKATAMEHAMMYAEVGDYRSAIEELQDFVSNEPTNNDIKKVYDNCCEAFVENVINEADIALAECDYNEATTILNEAIKVLPDADLKEKLAEVKAGMPVLITSLNPLNGSFPWNKGDPIDPFGNNYSDSANFAIFEYSYYAYNNDPFVYSEEYRLYGKYTRLHGCLVPYKSIYETGTAYFKVYADDVLVYASPVIVQKTDKFAFDVELSGAEYIIIEVTVGGRTSFGSFVYDKGAIILTDFMLFPA